MHSNNSHVIIIYRYCCRVAFIKELLELSAFEDILDPSDVLIVQEQVGAVQSVDSGTVCASTVLKIMGSSGKSKVEYKCRAWGGEL